MQGQVYAWPGHTDGSLVLVVGEHAFVGDLIRGGILDANQPETHFFMCDLEENRARIKELLTYSAVTTWHSSVPRPLPECWETPLYACDL